MKRRMLLILSALALLLASCGNKDVKSDGLVIPEDASMVIHVNSSSLSSKITWDEIKQSAWFLDISKKSEDSTAKQFFSNPGSSGINTKADIILYTKKQGSGSYMIVAGSVADANAFEKFCKTLDKEESKEVKKEKGFNYMTSENGAVVWNDKYFAFAGNSSLPDGAGVMKRFKRGAGESRDWGQHGYLPDSLKIFGMEALTGKSDNNLESDKRFASLVRDGNDIHFWINTGSFYSGMTNMLPLDTKPLLEGNVSAISLNFDNGKISARLKQYFGEKMSKLMSKSKTEPLSAAVINRIPSSNVAAVIAFNYSPDVVKEFLKVLGADAMADMILAKMDFSLDDFIRANKGQVLISISDPGMTSAPMAKKSKGGDDDVPGKKNKMNVLFATAVNDKATFEKMVTLIWDAAKKMNKESDVDMGKKAPPFSYRVENNWFAASNSAELTDKFLAGGDNKLPFTDKITGHPFAIYVDLQKIIGTMHRNFSAADTAKAATNIWQDIIATGGEYKEDALQFEAEVNMIDKNTNSLKQLNKYFDNLLHIKKGNFEIKEVILEDIQQEEEKPEPPPPSKKKANK